MTDLYYIPGSAAFAVHMMLEEVGAEYRLVRVERTDGRVSPPEFEGMSPHGRVPVLVDGDVVLYESAAIVMHLCDAHPSAGLAPQPGTTERALWYRWLVYLTNTAQPAFMAYFYPERFTTDEAGATAVGARAAASLDITRTFIERELVAGGPYLLGDSFSSADLYLFMLTRWGRRHETKWWDQPVLRSHFSRVFERPAVQRAWEQEGLDPWDGAPSGAA
jgi:glutathione S-transferase